ncbi:MAG: hypothetical protein ACTSPB_07050 [Candidatus Thorarchaeota archaeon]
MNKKIEEMSFMLIVLVLLAVSISLMEFEKQGITGMASSSMGVSILKQSEAKAYEVVWRDITFQIGPLTNADEWYSYNGSYGGTHRGYDMDYNEKTQTFTLENTGGSTVDALIAAEDFSNGSSYINVSKTNGEFQIYIPDVGWKNIPDNNDEDADLMKDTQELCIANDLKPLENVSGIDFRIKRGNIPDANYTAQIVITIFDNSSYSPCTGVGDYVTP